MKKNALLNLNKITVVIGLVFFIILSSLSVPANELSDESEGEFLVITHPDFIEAAESLGASRWTILTRIIIPLAKSGIIAGTALALGLSMSELGITILLYGPSWYTLAVQIYIESQWGIVGVAAAMGTVLIAIAATAVVIVHRLGMEVTA